MILDLEQDELSRKIGNSKDDKESFFAFSAFVAVNGSDEAQNLK